MKIGIPSTFATPACAAMLLASVAGLNAATLTVSSLGDSGTGSLRTALRDARAGDTINFSIRGTILLTSGELLVSKNLNILGPGAGNLVISGNSASRVFHVASRTTVTLAGITITRGFTTGPDGGIYSD